MTIGGDCLITINLAYEDIATADSPESLVMLCPRIAYLPAYYSLIALHFGDFVVHNASEQGTPALSFFFCHDQTQIPWHLPIGVLCDLVKFDSTESGSFDAEPRLDLTVRFKEPRRLHEFLIDYRSAESFSYLFLNQLKMGLIASGRPLAQFNILGKEEMQVLQSIAGGEVDGSPCIKAFVETFNSIYSEAYPAKSAAMKLYAVRWPDLQSTVLSIPLTDSSQVRVEDLLSQLHLPSESCVASLGVRLRAETPLQFLQERCCYGDGFVHLVVFLN